MYRVFKVVCHTHKSGSHMLRISASIASAGKCGSSIKTSTCWRDPCRSEIICQLIMVHVTNPSVYKQSKSKYKQSFGKEPSERPAAKVLKE